MHTPVRKGWKTELTSMLAPKPVAHWNFGTNKPYLSTVGAEPLELTPTKHGLRFSPDPHFGKAIQFDGQYGYLRIPSEKVGVLNVGKSTGKVTVSAWVKVERRSIGFIAGMWQENDKDPRRQYALFTNLDSYGGIDRVVGHVSRSGGSSPGLPFSRDCSATARPFLYGEWQHIAFTYDGERAISYLDGQSDSYPGYEEPPAPIGLRKTYSKNPYFFADGLNSTTVSDFTVGAVRLTQRMGNFFTGKIATLTVWNRALCPEEIYQSMLDTKPVSLPQLQLSLTHPQGFVSRSSGGPRGNNWTIEDIGFTLVERRQSDKKRKKSRLQCDCTTLWSLQPTQTPSSLLSDGFSFEISSGHLPVSHVTVLGNDRNHVTSVVKRISHFTRHPNSAADLQHATPRSGKRQKLAIDVFGDFRSGNDLRDVTIQIW